ncbi:hypothetical protein ACH427_04520 [Streptomyces sp. NPDC020379]|uniref:hypothetical protein n=1 Tax=Streptomyces sp. NPDC020379 TaxID=3365071 RepID=UPI00378E18F6
MITIQIPGVFARAYEALAEDDAHSLDASRRDLYRAWRQAETVKAGFGHRILLSLNRELAGHFADLALHIYSTESGGGDALRGGVEGADAAVARAASTVLDRLAALGITPYNPSKNGIRRIRPYSGDDAPEQQARLAAHKKEMEELLARREAEQAERDKRDAARQRMIDAVVERLTSQGHVQYVRSPRENDVAGFRVRAFSDTSVRIAYRTSWSAPDVLHRPEDYAKALAAVGWGTEVRGTDADAVLIATPPWHMPFQYSDEQRERMLSEVREASVDESPHAQYVEALVAHLASGGALADDNLPSCPAGVSLEAQLAIEDDIGAIFRRQDSRPRVSYGREYVKLRQKESSGND